MRGLLHAGVVLLAVSLAAAQEPKAGLSPTNQAASPAEETLSLALPKVGVELNLPQTPVIEPKTGLETGPSVELFKDPTNVATESTVVKIDGGITTAPLDSLQLKNETEVVRAGGMLATGPVVHILHVARPGEVPIRLLQLVNPFAAMESNPVIFNVPREHPRAWAEQVGWSPGVSAFPDPKTHQPTLSLLSMFSSP